MASTKRLRAISTLCALNVHATAGTYRWMDEQGRVHYSDRMPPESADRAYSVINPHGITVKSIDKTKPQTRKQHNKNKKQRDQIERENSFIRPQRAQQDEIRAKFAADVARYNQLRAAQAKPCRLAVSGGSASPHLHR